MLRNQSTRARHVTAGKEIELESIGNRAVEVVHDAASIAQSTGRRTANRVQKVVREHPLASLGVVLSGGVLIGAVGHKLLEHKQTFGEALAMRLGIPSLRNRLRHAI